MPSCAASPGATFVASRPGTRSKPRRWCTRLISSWSISRGSSWQNRAQFFAVAGELIRRILVDHARARHRDKRGGAVRTLALDEELHISGKRSIELIALDDALNGLAKLDRQQSRVVELRFFAGLTVEETAEVLQVSRATVNRDWVTARAWLLRELSGATG